MRTFRQRVRQEREKLRLTQQKFSERAGLSAKYVCEIETTERNPTVVTAVAIADALGVSLDYLTSRPAGGHPADPESRRISDLVGKLSPKDRARAFRILKEIFS